MSRKVSSGLRRHVLAVATTAAISSLLISAPAFAGRIDLSGLNGTDRHDRFIVKYRADVAGARNALDRVAGYKVKHLRRMALGADVIKSERKLDRVEAEALMRQIAADPAVQSVEVDAIMRPVLTPNDPRYVDQWGYFDADAGIRANTAWDMTNGAGTVVAVLDTGITSHSDLNANILPGYDFITDTFVSRDGDGRDANPSDPGDWTTGGDCYAGSPARNSSWHGTHVTGTVAALTNNSNGGAGTAFGARVVPARVLGRCGGYLSDIADAIVWASGGTVAGVPANANPAEVINMSLGGSGACGTTYQDAINSAIGRGTTVVVAAGNSNADVSGFRPANCGNVVAVAAVDSGSARASFSNYGAGIDVSAPGVSILSTLNTGTTSPGAETYAYYNGTSMAAPHVAGTVALMQSRRAAQGFAPYSPAEAESVLKATAYPLAGACSGGCGAGIIDASAAVRGTEGTKIFEQNDASGRIQIAVFERLSPVALSHNTDFAVSVPGDYVVIGGGVEGTNVPAGNLLTASYPNAALSAWLGSTKDHIDANPVRVRAWAVGLKIAGLTRQQVRDNVIVNVATSSYTAHPDVTATLPAGYALVGGGFKVNWSGMGNLGTASAPSGATGWRARSKDHIESSPATTQAYVIGLRNSIAGVGTISTAVDGVTSGVAAHPATTSVLRTGYALSGCGAFVNWSGAGNLLWKIRPVPVGSQTGCAVASKDHKESSPASISGYAIGIRAN